MAWNFHLMNAKLFKTSVRYFELIVSSDGVNTDHEKVQASKPWLRPQTLKELQSFFRFSGYYQRFEKDHSRIVKPLTKFHRWLHTTTEVGQSWLQRWETSCPVFGFVESLAIHADAIPPGFEESESQDGILTVPKYNEPNLWKLHSEDPDNLPVDHTADSLDKWLVLRNWSIHLKLGLLYRTWECEGQIIFQ